MNQHVMVAALFVAKGGCYFGLAGVDPWDWAPPRRSPSAIYSLGSQAGPSADVGCRINDSRTWRFPTL